jgi:hypothetical protein
MDCTRGVSDAPETPARHGVAVADRRRVHVAGARARAAALFAVRISKVAIRAYLKLIHTSFIFILIKIVLLF